MVWLVIMFLIFLALESYWFDPLLWKHGIPDKPLSTIIYFALAAGMTWFAHFEVLNGLILAFGCRAWFDPMINDSMGQVLCYHRDKNWYERFWRKMSCGVEMIVRLIWFILGIVIYYLV